MKWNSFGGLLVLSRDIGICILISVFLWLAKIQRLKKILSFSSSSSIQSQKTLFTSLLVGAQFLMNFFCVVPQQAVLVVIAQSCRPFPMC